LRPPATSNRFATRADELERALPARSRIRKTARGTALTVLGRLPFTPGLGLRIVHYHYVFDDEVESFSRQLAFLATTFQPVSLSEAVERLRTGAVDGRELVVTFDDGFRNQLGNAARRLADHGISACFFVITQLVSAAPDRAARICLEQLHLPRPVEPLDWDDLVALLDLGHEIGSHSRSHPNLAELGPAQLEEEVRLSRTELQQRLGRPIAHLSAPYGERARFSVGVSEAARAAGYASCSTAIRGRNVSADDLFSLRRDHLEAGWPVGHLRYFLGRG
jgi:peptidoglycan/xylan/chitin deacetylase (PgdA/CDA1 family)